MVQSLVNSIFNSQSYSVHGILIDPGDEWEAFYGVAAVLLTHAHFDHIYGLNRVIELNPSALVYTNQYGREALLSDRKNMSRYHGSSFVFAYPENIRIVSDGSILRIDDGTVAEGRVHSRASPELRDMGHRRLCIFGRLLHSGDKGRDQPAGWQQGGCLALAGHNHGFAGSGITYLFRSYSATLSKGLLFLSLGTDGPGRILCI